MVEKRKIGVFLDSKNQIFAQYIEWLRHDHYISERADVTFYKEFPLLLKEKNSIVLVDIFCSEYTSNLGVTFPAEVVIVLYPPDHKIQTINSWHKNIFVPSLDHLFNIKSILSYVLTEKKTPTSLLPISMGGDIPILNHGDIMYIKTDKSHTYIYTKFKKYLLRQSMSKTLSTMTGTEFVRIHRQYAVNREAITKINFQKMKVEVGDAVLPIGPVYKSGLKGLSWG